MNAVTTSEPTMFGDLVVNLIARVNQFTQPLGRARQSLSGFKADVGKSVGGVLSHFQGLTGIGAIVSSAVGGLTLGAALTWGASMAMEAEKAQIAFGTMLKSPEKAKLLLADLSTFAASTPYESPEITKAAKSLLAYGTSAQSIVPTLQMLGDVASGVGMPLEEIAYLFGTAQVQGKLFSKDINQFTGRGIPIIQALADVMKVSKGEVMGLAEKGKVTSDIMTQAFQHMTANGGQFAGMMQAQSQTTSGLFSTLKDNVGLALRDIAAAMMEGFNIKGMFGDVISITDAFRSNIKAWIPLFVSIGATTREWFNWLVSIVSKAMEFWQVVSPWAGMLAQGLVVLGGVFATFAAIAAVVALVMNPITWIVAGVIALGAGVGWVLEQFGGLAAVIQVVGFGVSQFGTMAKIVALEMLLGFTSTFNAIAFFFTDTLPAVFGWVFANGSTMFQNLANYASQVFVDLAGRLSDVFHDMWALATGGEMVGTSHWGELGGSAVSQTVPELKMPTRELGEFERSFGEMLAAERTKLSEAWSRLDSTKPKVHVGLDPSDPKYQSGMDAAVAAEKKKEETRVDVKPGKMAGALGVRTQEAYKAIVSAMPSRQGDPQTQQLQALKKIAANGEREGDDIRKIKEKLVDQGDQVLERI